jgi:hypothetical protein
LRPATPCRARCPGQSLPEGLPQASFRKWQRVEGCRHDTASEDAGREALTTSSRSSAAGAALAFTMPLVPPALCCFQQVYSHLLWGMSTTALAICSLDSGCLRLLPASGLAGCSSPLGSGGRPSGSASVLPPCGKSLSSAFVERAKQQALGPPGLEHQHTITLSCNKWM